jgi:cell division protein FtsB
MNAAWLLKSSTLWGALGGSFICTMTILLFSSAGLPDLRKRQAELREYQLLLLQKSSRNRELAEEVHRLSTKDPELLEALARRRGYARPGETIYTFRETGEGQ